MAETTFNAGISARNAIAAPYAAHGGTNNFYFANDGPGPSRKPFSNIPFPPDPDFVERPRITEWLRDKCRRPAGRAALVGLGGIGKSQLAVSYAHEVRQGAPDTYVFWVHAGTRERFEEAYHAIANRLQLPQLSDPKVDIVRLVYDWLCAEENGKWLMIVDNADDVNVFYLKPNAVQNGSMASTTRHPLASFLPQSINGKILVTSRSRDVAERLTGSSRNVLSINAMDEDQAHQLLRNKLQEAHDEEVAAELLQALEYMPLAITQAAAYILRRAPRMSPSTYLADFRKSEKKKASLLHRNMGDLRRDPSASNSIVTTWQMTFDSIRQERQSAADLLAFLSFFNPQGIPEWILLSYHRSKGGINETETIINDDSLRSRDDREVDSRYGSEANSDHDSESVRDDSSEDDSEVDEFEDDLNMLREFSLVTTTTQEGVFEMHPLVRFCTQIWLSTTENVRKWRRIFLHVMSREYPAEVFETWARCQELSFHIQSVVNDKPENKDDLTDFPQLLCRMGWYKMIMGEYKEAEQLIQQALKAFEKAFGKEHIETLWSVKCLAVVLGQQGRLEEAELMSRQALEGFEKALGKEHIRTLQVINNLAIVLQKQGRLEEAELMIRRALESLEKAFGKENIETLRSVNNLAIVLGQQGRLEEAELMIRQALEGLEKAFGKENIETLRSVNNLAAVLYSQGKLEEAEQMFRQVIEVKEKALGKGHRETLHSVWWLAYVYKQQSRLEEAYELYQRALNGCKVFGPDDSDLKHVKKSILSFESRFTRREGCWIRNQ